jgi:hypothetical protein
MQLQSSNIKFGAIDDNCAVKTFNIVAQHGTYSRFYIRLWENSRYHSGCLKLPGRLVHYNLNVIEWVGYGIARN